MPRVGVVIRKHVRTTLAASLDPCNPGKALYKRLAKCTSALVMRDRRIYVLETAP